MTATTITIGIGALPSTASALPQSPSAALSVPDTLLGLPLVFRENWEKGWDKWDIFDSATWKLSKDSGNTILQVPQRSNYFPPVYGPWNRAIIKCLVVRNFVMEARVRITEGFRDHRGGMIFFGYEDPAHLDYAHFAQVATDRTNTFGKVWDAPRFTFYQTRTKGIPWTLRWQTMRVVRNVDKGSLEAYVDDMTKPVFTANDITYQGTVNLYDSALAYAHKTTPVTQTDRYEWGRVGIGSFQGKMDYDEVRLWAEVKGATTGLAGSAGPSAQARSAGRKRTAGSLIHEPGDRGAMLRNAGKAYSADGKTGKGPRRP